MDIINLVHVWISLVRIMDINNSSLQIKKINNDGCLCKDFFLGYFRQVSDLRMMGVVVG